MVNNMSLLSILKSSKNARKVFGKRELKIVEKQLLGVNLTQSEKNRLSRDIRPKLEFAKEITGFSDEFGLKKGNEIKRMIDEAKSTILKDPLFQSINQVTVFGSAADNALSLGSDIDISVKFNKIDLKEATLFRKRISGRINPKIDIQVYNTLPEKIKTEINKKGRIIYCKNDNK